MSPSPFTEYQPTDFLYLWLLTQPSRPKLIGALDLVRSLQGASLEYTENWLQDGFALSQDLPLIRQVFLPAERGAAAGAMDDARPESWGERVIRMIDKPQRLSVLEYMFLAGDDRFGALGVSISAKHYWPRRFGPLPDLADADEIQELIRKMQNNEPIPQAQERLISPGATMGGARPKTLVNIDKDQWVIEFAAGDPADTPLQKVSDILSWHSSCGAKEWLTAICMSPTCASYSVEWCSIS